MSGAAGLRLLTIGAGCPRGVLSWPGWQAVTTAAVVHARDDVHSDWVAAMRDAGVQVVPLPGAADPRATAALLVGAAAACTVTWLGSPDGDPGLASELTRLLVQRSSSGQPGVEVEVVPGSWDPPGAALLDLVAVMDRLRSPGGCPWDAEQTHASLVPYALEEAYEVAEAVESGDRAALREELGDLLLQVVFHARVAEEDAHDPFGVDEVAAGIAAKLRRRHPHVFADGTAATAADVESSWEEIKKVEKRRASVLDGVPVAMPSLARAQKVLGRIERAGLPGAPPAAPVEEPIGERLLALVARARADGVDAETALREALRQTEAIARAGESAGQARGRPSAR